MSEYQVVFEVTFELTTTSAGPGVGSTGSTGSVVSHEDNAKIDKDKVRKIFRTFIVVFFSCYWLNDNHSANLDT